MHVVFLDFQLDQASRSLLRAGRSVALQPKVFDLLVFLLRHHTQVVPHDVLLRALWPDTSVTQASLTRLVKEARRAVGDDGRTQAVIRTLHGRGYRFVAEVQSLDGDANGEEERTLELARQSLEANLERGASELRLRVREFVRQCELAIRSARRSAQA
jgi:DNA-binding winged helix-turn-helix (wHTH) protein